jgi:hypothetical protein
LDFWLENKPSGSPEPNKVLFEKELNKSWGEFFSAKTFLSSRIRASKQAKEPFL